MTVTLASIRFIIVISISRIAMTTTEREFERELKSEIKRVVEEEFSLGIREFYAYTPADNPEKIVVKFDIPICEIYSGELEEGVDIREHITNMCGFPDTTFALMTDSVSIEIFEGFHDWGPWSGTCYYVEIEIPKNKVREIPEILRTVFQLMKSV